MVKNRRSTKKEEEEKQYEVERIIDSRYTDDGKLEYLIRWKGWSPNDDSWEPQENLACEDRLLEYYTEVEGNDSVMRKRWLDAKSGRKISLPSNETRAKSESRRDESIILKISRLSLPSKASVEGDAVETKKKHRKSRKKSSSRDPEIRSEKPAEVLAGNKEMSSILEEPEPVEKKTKEVHPEQPHTNIVSMPNEDAASSAQQEVAGTSVLEDDYIFDTGVSTVEEEPKEKNGETMEVEETADTGIRDEIEKTLGTVEKEERFGRNEEKKNHEASENVKEKSSRTNAEAKHVQREERKCGYEYGYKGHIRHIGRYSVAGKFFRDIAHVYFPELDKTQLIEVQHLKTYDLQGYLLYIGQNMI